MQLIPISVVIIARNAETTLSVCLDSLVHFEEVVVYVNNSQDNTLEIAKSFSNTHVFEGDFLGFGATKNHATGFASHDWVITVDADEVFTPALVAEIRALSLNSQIVYAIRRLNHYCDQLVRGCGWQNDAPVRLYNRLQTQYNNNNVHEAIITKNMQVYRLVEPMYHYPFYGIDQLVEKAQYYSTLYAQGWAGKKESSLSRACLSGLATFLKSYFIRYGIIDGKIGFVISCCNGLGSFLKYLKLWELNRKSIRLGNQETGT